MGYSQYQLVQDFFHQQYLKSNTLPATNISHLKIDSWKTMLFSLRGELLVAGAGGFTCHWHHWGFRITSDILAFGICSVFNYP